MKENDILYLTVPGLEKWQHYKDRRPPWMKLHVEIFDDYEFSNLPDATRYHVLAIWLLATQIDNKIPYDINWIQRKIGSHEKPDIEMLLAAGHIEYHPDSKALAERKQNALVETETETETETENICSTPAKKKSPTGYTPEFEAAWSAYPKREGGDSKADAFKAWNARLKQKHTAVQLMGGVQRYATYCKLKSIEGTEFVKRAATFFGPGNHFAQSWEVISGARQQPGRQSTPSMQRDQTHRDAYRELAGTGESEAGPEGGGGDFRKDAAPVGSAMDGEDWGDEGGDPGPGE